MNPANRITVEEFRKLPEEPGKRFELDDGKLAAKPSLTFRQSFIRQQIAEHLRDFVKKHRLGEITLGTDFRLGPKTVRNPDIAFVTTQHLKSIDIDVSPAPGAPALAVEIVSPEHSLEDLMARIRQYLTAGSLAVWRSGWFIQACVWWKSTTRLVPARWSNLPYSKSGERLADTPFPCR